MRKEILSCLHSQLGWRRIIIKGKALAEEQRATLSGGIDPHRHTDLTGHSGFAGCGVVALRHIPASGIWPSQFATAPAKGRSLSPVLDILRHVVTHGPYHRGQNAKVIGSSGGVAVNTDFVTFAWETERGEASESSHRSGL